MTWFLPIAALIVLAIYMVQLFARGDIPGVMRTLRYGLGGGLLAVAALLALSGRMSVGSILAFFGVSLIMRGRLGPIDLNPTSTAPGAKSKVRSAHFEMQMDHDSGAVDGKVTAGYFAGRDLMSVDEYEIRDLLDEVANDPDSLSLLETWLDVNRTGWREYLGAQPAGEYSKANNTNAPMEKQQAYEILGLEPGASEAEIKAAHRRLLKAVHPDQGGSNFLAARINAAKDFLLS